MATHIDFDYNVCENGTIGSSNITVVHLRYTWIKITYHFIKKNAITHSYIHFKNDYE